MESLPTKLKYLTLTHRLLAMAPDQKISIKSLQGESCLIDIATDAQGKILGAVISIGGVETYVERLINSSERDVINHIQALLIDTDIVIDSQHKIVSTKGVLGLLGAPEESLSPSPKNTYFDISDMTVHAKINSLVDEGSLEKHNWRLKMIDFAWRIFKDQKPQGEVILMPGSSNAEYSLWHTAFTIPYQDMIFIEGNKEKAYQLEQHMRSNQAYPKYVPHRMGEKTHHFANELLRSIDGDLVSIISFDTESKLTTDLYNDIVQLFSEIEMDENIFLGLNVVTRTPYVWCRDFIVAYNKKNGTKHIINQDTPLQGVLQILLDSVLKDARRDDLSVKKVETGMYLGGVATTMSYLFAHIKNHG